MQFCPQVSSTGMLYAFEEHYTPLSLSAGACLLRSTAGFDELGWVLLTPEGVTVA